MPEELRLRPGDQQLPVPNDGPSMHDLVIADVDRCWDDGPEKQAIADLLRERKQLGLKRYGSILQSNNGRDFLRDLREELADAAVYARQGLAELGGKTGDVAVLEVYECIHAALAWAHAIPEADRV